MSLFICRGGGGGGGATLKRKGLVYIYGSHETGAMSNQDENRNLMFTYMRPVRDLFRYGFMPFI